MSKIRITLVLLLAVTASHMVARVDAESVREAVAAMAFLVESPSLAIIAEALIMLAAILAVASCLKPRPRPKSALGVGRRADAAQAPGRR